MKDKTKRLQTEAFINHREHTSRCFTTKLLFVHLIPNALSETYMNSERGQAPAPATLRGKAGLVAYFLQPCSACPSQRRLEGRPHSSNRCAQTGLITGESTFEHF